MNCRSLKNKLPSLVTNFEVNKTSIAILTETWFQRRDRQLKRQLEEIEMKNNISFVRNDRDKRGGGVSVAFNSSVSDFRKIQLECMKGKKFELLAVVGKLHGIQKKTYNSSSVPPAEL